MYLIRAYVHMHYVYTYVCMYVCMYVCLYACMYVYAYTYLCNVFTLCPANFYASVAA